MGEQEKEELSTSISYGAHQMRDGVNLNQHRQIKPVVRSSDIMRLQDLEAYIKFPGRVPISKIQFSYLNLPCVNDTHVPQKRQIQENPSSLKQDQDDQENSSAQEEGLTNVAYLNINKKGLEEAEKFENEKNSLSFDFR